MLMSINKEILFHDSKVFVNVQYVNLVVVMNFDIKKNNETFKKHSCANRTPKQS